MDAAVPCRTAVPTKARTGGTTVGQHKQFEPGWEVPNDGFYIEVGEHPDSASIRDPRKVHLKRGDTFPATSNHNRKWVRMKAHNTKD